MNDDIEYIEPTQEHVGQMVEVRDSNANNWRRLKLLGIIEYAFKFIVEPAGFGMPVPYRFARIARPLTYAERQAKCGLRVGDMVRVIRKYGEDEGGFEIIYNARDMDCMIGRVYPISEIRQDYGIRLNCFWFPYFVLEKVEDRVATRRDIDATVYVDGNPQDVFTLEYWYSCDSQPCRAVVRSGDKRFVYELGNLRVKE